MSKFLRLFLPALLVMSLTAPSTAEETTVVEEPVYEDVTFYLHGTQQVGELEMTNIGERMTMDTTAPTATSSKSRMVTNYLVGPNSKCSGSWLFPSWDGAVAGTIQGEVRVVLNTLSHPDAALTVDLFADASGGCNDAYVPPVATQTVDLAAGQAKTEVIFKRVNFTAFGGVTVMVRPAATLTSPDQTRLFYDSVTQDSRVELQCLPPEGKTTCLY